jgi:hypothetical protein
MVTLDNSQRGQLERWQEEFKSLSNQQMKIENDLESFENLPLDVDGAKQQSADLKVNYLSKDEPLLWTFTCDKSLKGLKKFSIFSSYEFSPFIPF